MGIDREDSANQSVEEAKSITNSGKNAVQNAYDTGKKAKNFLEKKDKPSNKAKAGNNPSGPSSAAGKGKDVAGKGTDAAKKVAEASEKAAETSEKAAKVAKKGAEAAAKVASEAATTTARVGTDVATVGAAEAVNAPLDAVKRTAEAGKEAAEKTKEAAEKTRKAAQKIKAQAQNMGDSFEDAAKWTKLILVFSVIISITMPGFLASVFVLPFTSLNSYNYETNHEAYEAGTHKESSLGEKILQLFKKFGDDEKSLVPDAFEDAETYDDIMRGYTKLIYAYLNDSIETQKADIGDHLTFEVNGETVVADYDLTLANYESQGNPFASANIASIMAAYSVSQGSIDMETLPKFEKALRNAEPHMLHVTYDVVDENGNLYQQEAVQPYPIYKYNVSQRDLSGQGYLDYLKNFPEGHETVKAVVLESLDADISALNSKIASQQAAIGEANKVVEAKDSSKSEKKAANNTISNANGQIASLNIALAGVSLQRDNIASGIIPANVGMANPSNIGSHTVDVYTVQADSDGEPIVDHMIKNEEGAVENTYVLYEGDDEDVTKNSYACIGETLIVPEITMVTYAQVTFQPYNSADVFEMFGIDPNATYELSKNTQHPITNEQMYNMYYDTLSNITNMATFTSDSVLSQYCTLTEDEINEYVAIAERSGAHGQAVSKNRLQLIKTALGLTGAIPYQWGGHARKQGWDEEWWQSSIDGYKGLDCAGFCGWAQWTALGIESSHTWTTGDFSTQLTSIPKNELMPGDFGVIRIGGSKSQNDANHIGIFVGYNENKEMIWVHCNGTKNTVSVDENYNTFKLYLRNPAANIDGADQWKDDTSLYGCELGNNSEDYVIAKSLLGEAGLNDVGYTAVSEAICNCIGHGSPVTKDALLAKVQQKNYLEAYTRLFVNKEKDYTGAEPTAKHYQMIQRAMKGERIYITDTRVGYWRGKYSDIPSGYTFFGQFPAGTGNKFLYSNK